MARRSGLVAAAWLVVLAGCSDSKVKTDGRGAQPAPAPGAPVAAQQPVAVAPAAQATAGHEAAAGKPDGALAVSIRKLAYRKDQPANVLSMTVAFQNRSGQAIRGARGVLRFLDARGELVGEAPVVLDRVAPGKTVVWSGERRYQPSEPADRKLAAAALDKVKVAWVPAARAEARPAPVASR